MFCVSGKYDVIPVVDIEPTFIILGMEDMDINFEEWRTATDVVDNVVRLLLSEMSQEASGYKLSIDKCVKQGKTFFKDISEFKQAYFNL